MRKFIFIKLLVVSTIIYSQNEKVFYFPLDTISLEKPVIFSLNKYEGSFVTEQSKFSKRCLSKKRIKKSNKIYLLGFNPYLFSKEDNFNYSDKECKITVNNSLLYDSFNEKKVKFVVGLIKSSYYNKMTSTVDKEKTILYNSNKDAYYKIIFPICN